MGYCTRQDVYRLGLSAQAFVSVSRPVASANVTIATASIYLQAHGLDEDDIITFQVTTGGTLPTGISQTTSYYPIIVNSNVFRVALTPGGTPIASWASAGSGWGIVTDFGPRLDAHIENEAANLDQCLTAHTPPIAANPDTGRYPQVLVGMNARMAARSAVISLQIENPAYRVAVDRLVASEAADQAQLDRWTEGQPIQPRPDPNDGDAPVNAAIAVATNLPVPWTTSYL